MSYFKHIALSISLCCVLFVPLFAPTTPVSAVETTSEIKEKIIAPQLSIDIPGLDFSSPDDIADNLVQDKLPGGRTGSFISIPFLGEYIGAVYKYAVIIAGVIATIVIIISGIQWTASAGNASVVKSAQGRIVGAVVGLLLTVGSYIILFTINPELVMFDNFKVFYVETDPIPEDTGDSAGAHLPADGTVTDVPTEIDHLKKEHFADGTSWSKWENLSVAQKKEVLEYLFINTAECHKESTYTKTGINHCNLKNKRVHQSLIPALKTASQVADNYGFQVCAYNTYRPVKRQTQLWNSGVVKRYIANNSRWRVNDGQVARPSCEAPHNTGGALDMYMKSKKTGKVLVSGTNSKLKTQSMSTYKKIYFKENPPYKLIFEEIMKQSGFVRFCSEYWHFEYGVTTRYSKWDKKDNTRCVLKYQNWHIDIPQSVKDAANAAVQNGPLFK